ncbi:MAG: DotD/TraH family lipoprotein [Alphaproteobacteria bacterium]|nr:DotD/TraH family lipoprotein [Alphaproteobacteria bacterium]
MRVPGAVARLGAAGLAVLLAGALAGCSAWVPEPAAVKVRAGPDLAETLVPELRLVEAAERAERALASLARALHAADRGTPRHSDSAMPALDSVPRPLKRPVTLDWAGPLEGLAQALAERAGYRFLTAGRPPARPLIVTVEAENRPLLAVLRDAGLRAGGAATLTVDAAAEAVLLDWTLSALPAALEEGG